MLHWKSLKADSTEVNLALIRVGFELSILCLNGVNSYNCLKTDQKPCLFQLQEELNDENRHKSEIWYHGNIKREEAEQILMDSRLGDGAFLIRESATFQNKGECSLSFTYAQHNHCFYQFHCAQ